MRKGIRILAGVVLLAVLAGCGGNSSSASADKGSSTGSSSADVFGPASSSADNGLPDKNKSADKSAIDLTVMSSTMVYSEVYNMVLTPDDYVGRTIKMKGTCSFYHDDGTGKDYYACIIQDATQCCSKGIEFELTAKNYPKDGETITVTGTFDVYTEEGDTTKYCTLRNAQLN